MATGRMLRKQISLSEAVNEVSLKAALLFTWALAHADDFGRMPGSPRRIKAGVVPLRDDFSLDDVAACLEELQVAGLICWYEVDGERYVAFPTWDAHQSGLHKRTRSRLPPPPGLSGNPPIRAPEFPGNSGKFRSNGTEQNGTEGNGTEQNPSIASTIQGEDAPAREPDAVDQAIEAERHWRAAVGVATRAGPKSAYTSLCLCHPVKIEGSSLIMHLPPDTADWAEVERLMPKLRAALRMDSRRVLNLVMVDPNTEARAGPEVIVDAARAAGP